MPDYVPCDPDISNMVPCRLTGKPFWDIYAHQDPPLWKAYIDAVKHFGIDGGFELYSFGPVDVFADEAPPYTEKVVLRRADGSFATQYYHETSGHWSESVTLYTAGNPATQLSPQKLDLPPTPTEWEELTGVKQWPVGLELWHLIREEMGEHGVVGLYSGATTCLLGGEQDVYSYYEDPEPWREQSRERIRHVEERMEKIAQMDPRPDFLLCGASGSLIWQTPRMFRELGLPVLQRVTELAADIGIPTHVHACGPETALVQMAAEETKLTIIDPLETRPMGDCALADLKQRFGDNIVLKGNLHTTDVMLRGSVDDVVAASRKAIDDAAAGGGFILSTGDQCGRDTPDANIRAMVETARTYGKY
jgi:hypothetical protein